MADPKWLSPAVDVLSERMIYWGKGWVSMTDAERQTVRDRVAESLRLIVPVVAENWQPDPAPKEDR